MEPKIGLSESSRTQVSRILNTLLADEYVLYTETRSCHWNVVGPRFNDLHKFFETQYTDLNIVVDDVAERARELGGWAVATLSEMAKGARLKERTGDPPDARGMLANLLADHEAIVRSLRVDADACADEHHDMGTNDFLVGLMEQHEKMAWMLRSFLEGRQ